MADNNGQRRGSFFGSRQGLVFLGFLAVAGYFLWAEHEAHVKAAIPYLPWLLLLACPLMHLFMHRGHGSHDHSRHQGMRNYQGPRSGQEGRETREGDSA